MRLPHEPAAATEPGAADAPCHPALLRFLAAIDQPVAEIQALTALQPARHGPASVSTPHERALAEAAELITTLRAQFIELLALEAGAPVPTLEAVDAASVMAYAAQVLAQDLRGAGLQLMLDPSLQAQAATPLRVWADKALLTRVLLNLVSNAIKYNRCGGQVVLAIEVQDGTATLSVGDTGIGLSGEEAARLFQPFERLGKELSSADGTGMGLAISHRLTRLMNGRITMNSSKGKGSLFGIVLPLAGPSGVAPADGGGISD